jgi:hypothetical protein
MKISKQLKIAGFVSSDGDNQKSLPTTIRIPDQQ